jgi:hypothetical protein
LLAVRTAVARVHPGSGWIRFAYRLGW